MSEAIQFRAVHRNWATDDVEAAIRSARQGARRSGYYVAVIAVPSGEEIARVFPNGQVDVTWLGSRYA